FLSLEVDGERRASLSGRTGWDYRVVAIGAGSHVIRWIYEKDESISEGEDRGWVDLVRLASLGAPFLMEPTRLRVVAGGPADYQIPTYLPGASFGMEVLPDGMSLNDEGVLSGTPSVAGVHHFNLDVLQSGNVLTVPAAVEVIDPSPLGEAVEG
ncbi:MAG: hypothetical protein GWO24_28095, partial [Akkermansiaceae bacterium]|nr:hypothetical protein [Akkermansiaceae bacterium]